MATRDDTTKPSRVNRRRKKKWRMAIVDLPSQLDGLVDRVRKAINNIKITSMFLFNRGEIRARILPNDGQITARVLLNDGQITGRILLKITEFCIDPKPLTEGEQGFMLTLPFPLEAVGIRTPFTPGLKMAATLCGFFSSVMQSGFNPFLFCHGGLYWAAAMLAVPGCGSSNPIQSTAQSFELFDGGLSLFTRIKPMSQNKSAPKLTPLFSIYWHRQTVCQNVTGALALRFKRRHPEVVVKFVGMEG